MFGNCNISTLAGGQFAESDATATAARFGKPEPAATEATAKDHRRGAENAEEGNGNCNGNGAHLKVGATTAEPEPGGCLRWIV
jgi:hypothetical protein